MSKEISKFLSLVLRHDPEKIGIKLDAQGWTDVRDLLAKAKKAGVRFSHETLLQVVAENDKQRFTLSADGRKIRAAQGHSVAVDLGLEPVAPPAVLYHGTASASLDGIFQSGLQAQKRQKVHLSADPRTALSVGQRHGSAVVLNIDAQKMHADGMVFWVADNGVWLVDQVPPHYLSFYAAQIE